MSLRRYCLGAKQAPPPHAGPRALGWASRFASWEQGDEGRPGGEGPENRRGAGGLCMLVEHVRYVFLASSVGMPSAQRRRLRVRGSVDCAAAVPTPSAAPSPAAPPRSATSSHAPERDSVGAKRAQDVLCQTTQREEAWLGADTRFSRFARETPMKLAARPQIFSARIAVSLGAGMPLSAQDYVAKFMSDLYAEPSREQGDMRQAGDDRVPPHGRSAHVGGDVTSVQRAHRVHGAVSARGDRQRAPAVL